MYNIYWRIRGLRKLTNEYRRLLMSIGKGTKCLISLAVGYAIAISPYRDSKIVNFLIAITGG